MKTNTVYYKFITYILIFTLIFPFVSGFVLITPAYASNGSNSFFSLIKGLLSIFFLSFLSNDSDESSSPDNNQANEGLGDIYEPANKESNNQQRLNLSDQELDTLARAVYSEARGEPYEGQVAVASVVINRVKAPNFPNDVNGVVYQKVNGSYAFSAVLDGQIYLEPNTTAYQAVEDALNGWDPSNGTLYYYNPITATSSWIFENTEPVKEIGNHLFARLK